MSPKSSGMSKLRKKAVEKTNQKFAEKELELLLSTKVDLRSLRPQVSDSETFNKLIDAVEKSNAKNENIGELKNRIENLGELGLKVANELISILK